MRSVTQSVCAQVWGVIGVTWRHLILTCAPLCAAQVYGVIGVFGAARYGLGTQGNVLVNTWLGGRWEGALDLAVAAYLSISVPPMQVAPAN